MLIQDMGEFGLTEVTTFVADLRHFVDVMSLCNLGR